MCNIISRSLIKKFEYDSVNVLNMDIKYPHIAGGCISGRFNAFYAHECSKAVKCTARRLYNMAKKQYEESPEGFSPYELKQSYTITYNESGYISLYRDTYIYTGGAHGSTMRVSEVWNTSSGWMVTLGSFFSDEGCYKKLLLDNAYDIAIYRQENEYVSYFPDLKKNLKKDFDPESFYITENGVVIYYQQYDIAPYSEGIQEFLYKMESGIWDNNTHEVVSFEKEKDSERV